MWFSFVDDLGHTLSATTQDTRYASRRYWPHRVSQSSKHMSAYFLIKYSWVRSWEHSWHMWGYTLSLRQSVKGQCLTCLVQYTPSVLAQQDGAIPLPESRQTLKCCATTLPMVCHFYLRCEPITILIKEPVTRFSVCKPSSTHQVTYNDEFDTNHIYIRILEYICKHVNQIWGKW